MAVAHQRVSTATGLPGVVLWVLIFNHGPLQVSSFGLGSIPGIGGNSIPGLPNVGNFLGLGQCDLHIGNIFTCNEAVKNFNGANPPQASPSTSTPSARSPLTSPTAANHSSTLLPSSSFNHSSLDQSPPSPPAESPALWGVDSESGSAAAENSPALSPDSEAEADLTLVDPATIDANKASSDPNACCRAILHIHLTCLCSFLSLKMVMALQLVEGYLSKVASLCHIDFKGC